MPTYTHKNARNKPSAATPADLYTVPANTSFIGKITATNTGSNVAKIRIWMRPLGTSATTTHAIEYDLVLAPNSSYTSDAIVCIATDIITVQSDTGNVSFNLNGQEKV